MMLKITSDKEYMGTYKTETLQEIIKHDEKHLKEVTNGSLKASLNQKIEICKGLLKERGL